MTVTLSDLALYAAALFVLVATPGPVVAAVVGRAISSGWASTLPISAGVVTGDAIYPLVAIFGLTLIAEFYGEVLAILKYGGAAILLWMGWRLIRATFGDDGRLEATAKARTGWAGFVAGLLIIAGNPKAIFFYLAVLPGFFAMETLTGWDIAAIVCLSALVPFLGNLVWAMLADRSARLFKSSGALKWVNRVAGGALAGAGAAIATS